MKQHSVFLGLSATFIAAALAGCSSSSGGGGQASGGTPGSGGTTGVGGAGSGGANLGGASGGGAAGAGATGGGGGGPAAGSIGAPCTGAGDCTGGACITEDQGWPNGYCAVEGCSAGSCPDGSDCFEMTSGKTFCLKTCGDSSECASAYACHPTAGACVPGCTGDSECESTEVCNPKTLNCEPKPCTTGSCGSGLVCDTASGKCIPDAGSSPGPGPGPDCTGKLPVRDCTGTLSYCGELMPFEPDLGPGYEDYPLNGETQSNQYRSYLRRDAQMLVKYAAAYVECKAKSWNTGNGGLIGLGDMSESNGAIPGTSIGQPGHPQGTHVNGHDIDIGYWQAGTADNKLRPICSHTSGGKDQYHCVSAPDKLDIWRTSLFLGAMFTSEIVRVIGVDGQVGSLVENAMPALCSTGWLPAKACTVMKSKLAYEVTDTGMGWYLFHHHHLHLSVTGKLPTNPNTIAPDFGIGKLLVPGQETSAGSLMSLASVPGHALVTPSQLK
ncbi:MAG: hypothetical protein IPM35_06965 [Myxococcales bacterium]|nr:hypothetical protein [Myxococcales bacterium]